MLEAAESAAGPVLPVVDRWRLRDVEYSAVFSDGLDPDPAVVNAIRAFDPEYVPLLVRRVFQAPTGGVVIFGYHVIGRHIAHLEPGDPRSPVRLQATPSRWPYASDTIYAQRTWSIAWKKGSWQHRDGFPDVYLPHDMWLCRWMEAIHKEMFGSAQDIRAQIAQRWRAEAEAEQRELDAAQGAARARLHDDRHELEDAVDNTLHWMEHPRQQPDPTPEPKPFVQVVEAGQ